MNRTETNMAASRSDIVGRDATASTPSGNRGVQERNQAAEEEISSAEPCAQDNESTEINQHRSPHSTLRVLQNPVQPPTGGEPAVQGSDGDIRPGSEYREGQIENSSTGVQTRWQDDMADLIEQFEALRIN